MDDQVIEYLKNYRVGEANAVTSRELERIFHLRGAELRKMVNRLRRKGIPLCSDAQGYYYAETEEELNHTVRQLLSRSREIAAAAVGMMKALPQYRDDGQLSLPLVGGEEA